MKIQIQYSCFHIFTKITEIDMCQIISLSFSPFFLGGGGVQMCVFAVCMVLHYVFHCKKEEERERKLNREREGTKKKINRERKGGREKDE